jgi:chromosomal replication initiator protein
VTFKPLFDRKRLLNKIISTEFMNKTANQYGKLFVFYKDNIQDQAFKTWFEPIKSVELTDNALYIQVPSKFFTNG